MVHLLQNGLRARLLRLSGSEAPPLQRVRDPPCGERLFGEAARLTIILLLSLRDRTIILPCRKKSFPKWNAAALCAFCFLTSCRSFVLRSRVGGAGGAILYHEQS